MKMICMHCKGTGTISAAELPIDQRRLLAAMQANRRGATVEDLIIEIYGERALLDSRWALHALIKRLNRRLVGARIVADRPGPGARYRLIEESGRTERRVDHAARGAQR